MRPDNELYPQLKRSTVPAVLRFFTLSVAKPARPYGVVPNRVRPL